MCARTPREARPALVGGVGLGAGICEGVRRAASPRDADLHLGGSLQLGAYGVSLPKSAADVPAQGRVWNFLDPTDCGWIRDVVPQGTSCMGHECALWKLNVSCLERLIVTTLSQPIKAFIHTG